MAAGTPLWHDELAREELTQLVRGAGVIAQPRPDVLVVGGGIVGGSRLDRFGPGGAVPPDPVVLLPAPASGRLPGLRPQPAPAITDGLARPRQEPQVVGIVQDE